MLNHKYRFHSRGGVKYVYRHGKVVRGREVSLIWTPNGRGFTRVAIVVSKKVEKTAVGRNRIRRRVYAAVRENFNKLPKRRDYIFVVYNKAVGKMKWGELKKLVVGLLAQVK